jgi:hypothetical protein
MHDARLPRAGNFKSLDLPRVHNGFQIDHTFSTTTTTTSTGRKDYFIDVEIIAEQLLE